MNRTGTEELGEDCEEKRRQGGRSGRESAFTQNPGETMGARWTCHLLLLGPLLSRAFDSRKKGMLSQCTLCNKDGNREGGTKKGGDGAHGDSFAFSLLLLKVSILPRGPYNHEEALCTYGPEIHSNPGTKVSLLRESPAPPSSNLKVRVPLLFLQAASDNTRVLTKKIRHDFVAQAFRKLKLHGKWIAAVGGLLAGILAAAAILTGIIWIKRSTKRGEEGKDQPKKKNVGMKVAWFALVVALICVCVACITFSIKWA